MYSGSSIDLPVSVYQPFQPDNYRSKLKSLIRRFGRHSTKHRDITYLKNSRSAKSSVSLAKSFTFSEGAGMFNNLNDDMAWRRPSSRVTTSEPSARSKRHQPKSTTSRGQADMLDDDNNAWMRPPTDVSTYRIWGRTHA